MMLRHTQRAFTLIELILVIIILGILALGTVQYFSLGVQIYAEGSERLDAIGKGRFVLSRLSKELRSATPNSVRISCDNTSGNSCSTEQCLEYTPFISSLLYTGNAPSSAPFNLTTVDADLGGQPKATAGTPAVINAQLAAHIYDASSNRRAAVTNLTENGDTDDWQFDAGFATDSVANRIYFLSGPVSICVVNNQVLRYTGYPLQSTQPNTTDLTNLGAEGRLLSNAINNNLSSTPVFELTPLSLTRNSVVNVSLAVAFNVTQEIEFDHEIHVPNVP